MGAGPLGSAPGAENPHTATGHARFRINRIAQRQPIAGVRSTRRHGDALMRAHHANHTGTAQYLYTITQGILPVAYKTCRAGDPPRRLWARADFGVYSWALHTQLPDNIA
jgi:hypothetical protein